MHVCDGWSQCPQHDDEHFCNLTCPPTCVCHGHSYLCRHTVSLSNYTRLRFLHASGSGMQLSDLDSNMMLIYLNLSKCKLTNIGSTLLVNLHSLDLSFICLSSVKYDDLKYFPSVNFLSLAGNPIVSLFGTEIVTASVAVPTLLKLDLSSVEMKTMAPSVFRFFSKLQALNLSHCNVHHVQGPRFQLSTSLQVLDVRGCPLTSLP